MHTGGRMITRITSKDNLMLRRMKRLESKKFRDKLGLFVLEGITVLKEAIEEGARIDYVIYSDSFAENSESIEIIEKLQAEKVNVYSVDNRLFASVSGTETPQGIIAAVEKPEWDADAVLEEGTNIIVLDRVADPGNMGTIIRTAEAAGFSGILVIKGSTDPYSGKVSRSASGALMRMPVLYADSPQDAVDMIRSNGKNIVCTDPRSDKNYYDVDLAKNAAIVIGNEAAGVCEELFGCADISVGIPMEGKTESLNAAIAASVMMYESLRQKLTR